MRETLKSLIALQEVLIRLSELDRLLSTMPPEVVGLENEWKGILSRLASLKTREEEVTSELSKQQTLLAEARTKFEKFEKDLHEVTNNKEYSAVLKEIDVARKKVASLEEEVGKSNKELAEIQGNIEECDQLEAETKTKYEEALATYKESLSDNEQERTEKTRIKEALTAKIPQKLMRQFNRIAQRRKGIGLAMCIGYSCQACHVRIRPNIVDQLRSMDRIISCDNCKRILVYAEGE